MIRSDFNKTYTKSYQIRPPTKRLPVWENTCNKKKSKTKDD